MAKFHINPKTGNVGQCKAEVQCPFGGIQDHYDSPELARAAYEKAAEAELAQGEKAGAEKLVQPYPAPKNGITNEYCKERAAHLLTQPINDQTWKHVRNSAFAGMMQMHYTTLGFKNVRGPKSTERALKRMVFHMENLIEDGKTSEENHKKEVAYQATLSKQDLHDHLVKQQQERNQKAQEYRETLAAI